MKLSEMTEAARKEYLHDAYQNAVELHESGDHPDENGHPSRTVLDWMKRGRDARDTDPANVASSKEIERTDHAADDPPPTPGTPRPPQRAGGSVAQDAALDLELLRIRESGTPNLEGELHLARIRHGGETEQSVAAMIGAIPGFGRLR